ncbi:Nucleolar complex protein 3, partial [Blattella germanica]
KKGKKKISSVKQKTLKHAKLSKQGKLRGKRNKKKSLLPKKNRTNSSHEPVPVDESDHGEDMLQMIDKDDLTFLQNAVANDNYSLLSNVHHKENLNIRKRKRDKDGEHNAVEKHYEEMAAAQMETKRTKHLLPIKTKDGLIQRSVDEDLCEEEDEVLEPKETESVSKPEEIDSDMELMMDPSNEVKGLNPDKPAKNFKRLLDMMDEEMPELRITVCKLATVSLLEVFKDDIVNVLNQLLEEENLGYREQLHCVQTVFTILSGQGEVLNIDPLRFYTHLYRNMFLIHAGLSHSDTLTVLQTLEKSLIQRRKKISQQRIYSFIKRLATLAMQLLHNGTLGCLAVIKTVMQLNRSVDILLDPDTSVGQGIYYPELEDPEYCNASSTAMWELVALERHYHPTVTRFARNILLGVPASDLFTEFDPSEMVFKPIVPAPKKIIPKSKPTSHFHLRNDDLANYIQHITERQMKGTLDFSRDLFPSNT